MLSPFLEVNSGLQMGSLQKNGGDGGSRTPVLNGNNADLYVRISYFKSYFRSRR